MMELIGCSNDTLCPGFNSCSVEDIDNGSMMFLDLNYNRTCNCSSWNDDSKHATAIAGVRIVTSIFSIVGSASIILSVLLTGKLSAAEVHPLFILSVADFILSILWMIGGAVWINPGEGGWGASPHTGMCYVLGIATTMMELVTFFLTCVYALNALLRIKEVYENKGLVLAANDSRKKIRHIITVLLYITSWVLPLLLVLPATEKIVGIEFTNNGCWCVLDFYNLRPDDGTYNSSRKFNQLAMIHATILGVSFVIVSAMMIVMYTITFLYARKVIKQAQYVEKGKGDKVIRTILKRLTLYLAIFLVCGFPALLASFVVWNERERLQPGETGDLVVLFIHAIFIPLQGFLNVVVYGWSRKEFRKAINVKERIQYRNRARDYESLNQGRTITSSYRGPMGVNRVTGNATKT